MHWWLSHWTYCHPGPTLHTMANPAHILHCGSHRHFIVMFFFFNFIIIICSFRKWQPTPVLLPRESCGQRSLVGCCPWGRTESDTTEATWHTCMHWRRKWQPTPVFLPLEDPRDRGAWWAAVYWVAQSWTWLKQLSSSSRKLKIVDRLLQKPSRYTPSLC